MSGGTSCVSIFRPIVRKDLGFERITGNQPNALSERISGLFLRSDLLSGLVGATQGFNTNLLL